MCFILIFPSTNIFIMNTLTKRLDLAFARRSFPSLASNWAFFDNAGGSQTLKSVVDRIQEYYYTSDVQHGGSYAVSQLSMQRVAEANAAMAQFVNAHDQLEIVMGHSTTMQMRILSLCLSQTFEKGDEIIVSNSDHEANVSPWMDLKKAGFHVKIWEINPDSLVFDLDDLAALMTEKTRLVTMVQTSNILGTINPIKEITEFVHDRGALMCVDAVGHVPHRLPDVQDLDVDFYGFSCYKVFGPHSALLYGKKEHLLSMPGINHYFIQQDDLPYKFQPGNLNFELTHGMVGVVDYLKATAEQHGADEKLSLREKMQFSYDLFTDHEEILAEKLLRFLRSKASVRIIGKANSDKHERVSTISFVVKGKDSESFCLAADPHKVAIRFGDFYAKKIDPISRA